MAHAEPLSNPTTLIQMANICGGRKRSNMRAIRGRHAVEYPSIAKCKVVELFTRNIRAIRLITIAAAPHMMNTQGML